MKRAEVLQGLRQMKFEEILERAKRRRLSQAEAASILGMSERTFRRWRGRFEAEGAEGLYDRRLGKVSGHRVPVDTVMEVLELFDTRYWDFTAKHFHEKLLDEHGFTRSYNWVRLTLQAHGRKRPAPRLTLQAHGRKRPAQAAAPRALPAMMLHQDGSTHQWVPGQWWDLIVTMDDATSEIYSAFFVDEEGTMSSFRALGEVIEVRGLFCSLYADRASHYWHTPEAGGKVDKNNPTQVGRALGQLGIELIPAYSPEARGRSERMFATLQNRLPQELRLAAITTMAEANPPRRVPARDLSAPPQHPFRGAGRSRGLGLCPLHRIARRHPVHPGGPDRRQRQHGALQAAGAADPGGSPPPPLRQGIGAGPRILRRHPGGLPRPAPAGPISGRRHRPRRNQEQQSGRVNRFDARPACG